jgi:hypothetical protein
MRSYIQTLLILTLCIGVLFLAYKNTYANINQPSYLQCNVLETIVGPNNTYTIELMNDECQEGLSHTTDARTVRMTNATYNSHRKEEILRHERVHLAQKRNYKPWYEFYEREWMYECLDTPPPSIPQHLINRLRPNPDTYDTPWTVWKKRWVFFPVFESSRTLKNATVAVWDLKNHTLLNEPPDEWKSMFCGSHCPTQYEHPHEISAEWFTNIKDIDAPAAQKLKFVNFYRNE